MKAFLSVMGCALFLSAAVGYFFWGMMLPWMIDLIGIGTGGAAVMAKVLIVYAVIYGGGIGIPLMILFVGFLIAINVVDDF